LAGGERLGLDELLLGRVDVLEEPDVVAKRGLELVEKGPFFQIYDRYSAGSCLSIVLFPRSMDRFVIRLLIMYSFR
jgi:hypothetical protein